MGGEYSMNGGEWEAYRSLLGKPKEKRPLERSSRSWANNIKIDLGEMGWVGLDSSGSG
jgi:hypothetical protein